MAWSDFLTDPLWFWKQGTNAAGQIETFLEETSPNLLGGGQGATTTPDQAETARRKRNAILFLGATGAIMASGVIIPLAMQTHHKRKGKAVRTQMSVEDATKGATAFSNNIATILSTPAIALPFGYITVQALEDAGIITKGVGNAAQGLMATAAAGGVISGLASVISKVV